MSSKFLKALAVFNKAKAIHDDPMSLVKDNPDFQKAKAMYGKGKAMYDQAKALHDDPMSAVSSLVKDNPDFQNAKAMYDKAKAVHDDPMSAVSSLVKDNPDFQNAKAIYDKGKAMYDKAKAVHDDPMALVADNPDFQNAKAMYDKAKAVHDDPMALVADNPDIQQATEIFNKGNNVYNLLKDPATRKENLINAGKKIGSNLLSSLFSNPSNETALPPAAPKTLPSTPVPKKKKVVKPARKAKAVKEVDELYYIRSGLKATSKAWEGEMEVLELHGVNGISKPYEYQILIHTQDTIELSNQSVYIFGNIDDSEVALYGYIGKVEYQYTGAMLICKVFVYSSLHKLRLSGKNRIFENKTCLEVITGLLDEFSIEYEDKTTATLEPLTYIVQYEQSDFDFLMSLFNRSGVLFSFSFSSSSSTLLLINAVSDLSSSDPSLSVDQAFQYGSKENDTTSLGLEEDNVFAVRECRFADQSTFQGVQSNVYDFTQSDQKTIIKQGKTEYIEYAQDLTNGDANDVSLTTHLNEEKMQANKIFLIMQYFLLPGTEFDFLLFDNTKTYIALTVQYSLTFMNKLNRYMFRANVEGVKSDKEISVIHKNIKAKKIYGVQLAKVMGNDGATDVNTDGQETNTDEWGRVRIRFLWDEKYLTDDNTSDDACWARVMHSGAGGTSHFYLPRVGDEVMVSFENGDPEKPIVIGSLYNSINTISHDPSSTDISYWKMLMSGQTDVSNEISMLADADTCLLKMNACKDMLFDTAENFDHNITAGKYTVTNSEGDYEINLTKGNMTNSLTEGDLTQELTQGNYKADLTKGNYDLALTEGNYKADLTKGNFDIALTKGNYTFDSTKGNYKLNLTKGDYTTDVVGNHKTTISQKYSLDVTGNMTTDVTKNRTITVKDNDKLTISSGNYTINIDSGKLTINAGQSILLKAPSITCSSTGTLTLDAGTLNLKGKTAIKMQAPQINCEAAGALALKGGGSAKIEGAALELKGAMIKLN